VSVATPLRSIVEATRHDRATAPYVPQYCLDDSTSEQALVVVPLSNWGKHWLYVNTADGQQVGWVDLDTGERSLVILELAFEFEAAIKSHDADEDDYQPRRGVVASAEHPRTSGAHAVRRFESTPVDLSEHRPAEQLEAQISAALEPGQEPMPARPDFSGRRAWSGWELGVKGERTVAEELDELVALDPRWASINSIPVGSHGSVIDHLVVGPAGVFAINAWQHDAPHSRPDAELAGMLLSTTARTAITVRGVIAPVGVDELTVNEQPIDEHVVAASELVDFLIDQPEVLDAYTIALVLTCARLSSTWRPASTSV
jgi:hypothetical protein